VAALTLLLRGHVQLASAGDTNILEAVLRFGVTAAEDAQLVGAG
jgi:hypothetical protein